MNNESVFDSDDKFSKYIEDLASKPIEQGLMSLAGNAIVNLPAVWKSKEDENSEVSLRMFSGSFNRQREAARKLDVLKPLVYDPLAMLILPNILSLPFSTQEEKDSIEKEAKIVTDFWSGK